MMNPKLPLLPRPACAVLGIAFSLLLNVSAARAWGNLDDCGTLLLTDAGCLVFAPDHHPGIYTLDNYGGFGPGERVHVTGRHDPNYYCACQSRCIRRNAISPGCSTLCSGVESDANNDGRMNIADILAIIRRIFSGGEALACPEQGDCNSNGRIDIGDVTCMLRRLL